MRTRYQRKPRTFRVAASEWAIEATLEVDTPEEAREIAASFPKSAKVHGQTLHTYVADENGHAILDSEGCHQTLYHGWVSFHAKIKADDVNGGRNETGIRRYRSFSKAAEKLGFAVEYDANAFGNSLSVEELEEATS
jgi:hypothetical protein